MRERLLQLRRDLNAICRDLESYGHEGRIAAQHLDDAFDGVAGALRQFRAPVEPRDDDEPVPALPGDTDG